MLDSVQVGLMPHAIKFEQTYSSPSSHGNPRFNAATMNHAASNVAMHDPLSWSGASSNHPVAEMVASKYLPIKNESQDFKESVVVPFTASVASPTTASTQFSIPSTIKTPHDNICQLAAEVACLFWFESLSTIRWVEQGCPPTPEPVSVSPLCKPTAKFLQWLESTLLTTGVAQNVILLGLLLVHRFKIFKPKVIGQPGSEYRMMTVALMLGNKFLDDNTYTNKTWSEVTHIDLKELHVLEVEFLSHLRYNLFTDSEEWDLWHGKMTKFGKFAYNFGKKQVAANPSVVRLQNPIPSNLGILNAPSFPANPAASYHNSMTPITHTPTHTPPIRNPPISLKRSFEDLGAEPPAKRHLPSFAQQFPAHAAAQMMPNTTGVSRVALPSLVIPQPTNFGNLAPMTTTLPPPGMNAMSMVYPTAPARQQVFTPNSMPPMMSTVPSLDTIRQLSPHTDSPAGLSPTGQFQMSHSPSFYLSKRLSPFRPVNRLHYLASQGAPPTFEAPHHISQQQMQYHPIGHPTERHLGQIPYFSRQAWPQNVPHMLFPTQS